MLNISYRNFGELIAVICVILSLIFVGLELRQSTIASKAAAFQELGRSTADIWFMLANDRELNDLIRKIDSIETFQNLSESDRNQAESFTVGILRLYETVYLQVEQGLLEPNALQTLGWEGFGKDSMLLKVLWPEIKTSVDSSFATYLGTEVLLENNNILFESN